MPPIHKVYITFFPSQGSVARVVSIVITSLHYLHQWCFLGENGKHDVQYSTLHMCIKCMLWWGKDFNSDWIALTMKGNDTIIKTIIIHVIIRKKIQSAQMANQRLKNDCQKWSENVWWPSVILYSVIKRYHCKIGLTTLLWCLSSTEPKCLNLLLISCYRI